MIFKDKIKLDIKGLLKKDPAAIDGLMFWAINKLPNFGHHVIVGPDGSPYLLRIYLTPKRFWGAWWPGIFLHKFFRSDHDRDFHNHPWYSSMSFILTNGYTENRWNFEKNGYDTYNRKPFTFNHIKANDFHRVDLKDEVNGCWTLFFAFKHAQEWGFWSIEKNKFIPWKEYLGVDSDGLVDD